jgi:hypothetical protein
MRIRGCRGPRYRQRGRIGRQDAVWRDFSRRPGQQLLLELEAFRSGLDHQLRIADRRLEPGLERESLQRRVPLVRLDFPDLHSPLQVRGDLLHGTGEGIFIDVEQPGVEPGCGTDLGDTVTHGAGAENGHTQDRDGLGVAAHHSLSGGDSAG